METPTLLPVFDDAGVGSGTGSSPLDVSSQCGGSIIYRIDQPEVLQEFDFDEEKLE